MCEFTLYVKVILIKFIKFKFKTPVLMNLNMCLIYKKNLMSRPDTKNSREWPKLTNPVYDLMQFKKSRTHRQTDGHTYRHTDTQSL